MRVDSAAGRLIQRARQVDVRLLVVVALPLLQAAVNNQWLFTSPDTIDPWVYFGYLNDLPGHLRAFADTYYGARLAWLVPGALSYRIFSPVLANYVLHLGMSEVALVSLYLILRATVRRDIAFFSVVVTAANPSFLWSMGWDYVDGAGIVYFLLTMCFLTYATGARRRYFSLFLAGAAFAGDVHTHIIWLAFVPLVAAYALLRLDDRGVRPVMLSALGFALGAAVATGGLAAVNARMTGDWLFFMPSFSAAPGLVANNPWKVAGFTWLAGAYWLVVPGVVFIAAVWFLQRVARRKGSSDRAAVLLVMQYVLFVLILIALEIRGVEMFETSFYASYLIPATALAFAGVLHATAPRGLAFDSPIVAMAGIAAATVPYVDAMRVFARPWLEPVHHVGVAALCVLCAAAALVVARAVAPRALTMVFLVALACGNVLTQDIRLFAIEHPSGRKDEIFRLVAAALPVVKSCGPDNDARLWFDRTERHSAVFTAIASTQLWGYRLLGDSFPSLLNSTSASVPIPAIGDRLVVMAGRPGRWREARGVFQTHGLSVDNVDVRTVSQGSAQFDIACLEVAGLHADAAPFAVPAARFTRAENRGAAAAVAVGPDGQSLEVTTNRSQYDYQVLSDAIPVSRGVNYDLELDMRVVKGGMGITIMDDAATAFVPKYWCRPGRERRIGFSFRTENASSIRIILANCGYPAATVSTFSIGRVLIWRSSAS